MVNNLKPEIFFFFIWTHWGIKLMHQHQLYSVAALKLLKRWFLSPSDIKKSY